jgi:hypothetical protein
MKQDIINDNQSAVSLTINKYEATTECQLKTMMIVKNKE